MTLVHQNRTSPPVSAFGQRRSWLEKLAAANFCLWTSTRIDANPARWRVRRCRAAAVIPGQS